MEGKRKIKPYLATKTEGSLCAPTTILNWRWSPQAKLTLLLYRICPNNHAICTIVWVDKHRIHSLKKLFLKSMTRIFPTHWLSIKSYNCTTCLILVQNGYLGPKVMCSKCICKKLKVKDKNAQRAMAIFGPKILSRDQQIPKDHRNYAPKVCEFCLSCYACSCSET